MLRPPLQSSFALQPLKVSTHHARPYIVFIWFAYLCSPYTIKSARVSAYPLPPLQSLNTSRTFAVSVCSSTSKVSTMSQNPMQSLYSRNALQSSYEQKRKSLCLLFCACSLHSYKIPLQSPYISPISKVPPHLARLCSLHLLRVPLRSWCDLCALAPCAHYWRAGGIGLYMIYFCTAGRCPNQWAVQCRHVRRSHRRYTQIYSRRV